jgi:steroid Delta-isomerase
MAPMTAPAATDSATATERVVAFFEGLTPQSVADIPRYYDTHARFKDPFNDVTGLRAIEGIFAHMFVALESPRFVVTGRIVQGQQCFLMWEFRFRFKNFQQSQEQVILGGSHLVFSSDGLVTLHRDYWDAAEELYEKLPVVGSVMRWLKKRANS